MRQPYALPDSQCLNLVYVCGTHDQHVSLVIFSLSAEGHQRESPGFAHICERRLAQHYQAFESESVILGRGVTLALCYSLYTHSRRQFVFHSHKRIDRHVHIDLLAKIRPLILTPLMPATTRLHITLAV